MAGNLYINVHPCLFMLFMSILHGYISGDVFVNILLVVVLCSLQNRLSGCTPLDCFLHCLYS